MRSLRRLLRRQDPLNRKLRKAVAQGKPRVVADLLEAGASPTWVDAAIEASGEMNALLLACHYGDLEVIDLLLDSFFDSPQSLGVWGRHMYCIVIRNAHWKAFRRLVDRKVPQHPSGSTRSMLPAPIFIAAEAGQAPMLQFLARAHPGDASGYSFNGHSLLSIASKNGHYDCVEVLLGLLPVGDEMLDFAIQIARQQSQAHVLVLLTSCLPQYSSNNSGPIIVDTARRPSVTFALDKPSSSSGSLHKAPRRSSLGHNRGSLAETEVLSEFGDDERFSSADAPRRSSTWIYKDDKDLEVYHPYLVGGGSQDGERDAEETRRYEAYIQALDAESEQDWTTTPPVSSYATARSQRTLSTESEEKAQETLARIADRREATKKEMEQQQQQQQPPKKKKWFYHDEVILPYDASDSSTATTSTLTSFRSPPSGKPPLPPSSTARAAKKDFFVSPMITRISHKVISVRSKRAQLGRASA